MPNPYYQLARRLGSLTRQELAIELQRFHQQTIDAVSERAAEEILLSGIPGAESLARSVRSLELSGRAVLDDRLALRHAEAVLWVLRDRRALIVARGDVKSAFDAGNGVDLIQSRESGTVEIIRQEGKFNGQ